MKSPTYALAGVLALTVAGCNHDASQTAADPPKATLKVETVHAQNIGNVLEVPGRVQADPAHLVHIYAPLSGRLMDLSLTPGEEVHKGQTIAMLQSGDVAQARSDFEKAHIETLRADRALDRGKVLLAHEVMSQADFQELSAADAAAHAEQERARQRVHELGFSEDGTTDVTAITAPISGTVLDVGTASGELQRSLETTNGIATVANLDTIWVTGDLFEHDLGAVLLHETVDIFFSAYPGQTFHGTIANIGDSLDTSTHAVKVRVVLANPGHRLKPAMFATLRIAQPAASLILLPLAAVRHQGDATDVAPLRLFLKGQELQVLSVERPPNVPLDVVFVLANGRHQQRMMTLAQDYVAMLASSIRESQTKFTVLLVAKEPQVLEEASKASELKSGLAQNKIGQQSSNGDAADPRRREVFGSSSSFRMRTTTSPGNPSSD